MKIKEYNVTATATDGSERDLLSPNIQQAEHRASEYKQLGYKNIKITPIYEKEKSKQKRKKFLGVFQKGTKIKSHIYKRGTKIKSYDEHQRDLLKQNIQSDYPTQNVETIWNDWTIEQRKHFLIDHEDRLIGLNLPLNKIVEFKNIKYENLPIEIANVLIKHIETGRYEHGTKIESTNERNENYYENVVNELLNDNAISTIRMKTYGCEIMSSNNESLPIKLTRSDMLALIIKSNVEFMNYDEKQILNELTQMTKLLLKK